MQVSYSEKIFFFSAVIPINKMEKICILGHSRSLKLGIKIFEG